MPTFKPLDSSDPIQKLNNEILQGREEGKLNFSVLKEWATELVKFKSVFPFLLSFLLGKKEN
jgi:hypothetical protein